LVDGPNEVVPLGVLVPPKVNPGALTGVPKGILAEDPKEDGFEPKLKPLLVVAAPVSWDVNPPKPPGVVFGGCANANGDAAGAGVVDLLSPKLKPVLGFCANENAVLALLAPNDANGED
jgi:hypothetical protein